MQPKVLNIPCLPLRPGALLCLLVLVAGCRSLPPEPEPPRATRPAQPGYVKDDFVFAPGVFPSAHASTLVETPRGVRAAWFAGPHERHPEVQIWTAQYDGARWSGACFVANGVQVDGTTRYPCWNPVLFQPQHGPLLLFYKVGPSPSSWWGMLTTSTDNGRTWSESRRLPDGQVGPVRNKPVQWRDGSLLCGASTEDQGWRIHMERTTDLGRTWERTPPLNDGQELGLIQPTILRWGRDRTQILCRSRQKKIYESWMGADWKSWSPPAPTALPNPNSAIDAVMLEDGRALLVYNHTPDARSPLNVAVSRDGRHWQAALVLENGPGEYSYPAVIQARDGLVHITYTWNRQRIKHVVLDPRKLQPKEYRDGEWPN